MCPISLNFEILNIECGGINICLHRFSRKEGFHKHAVQLEAFSEETVRRTATSIKFKIFEMSEGIGGSGRKKQ
jgi:hypothetical protein